MQSLIKLTYLTTMTVTQTRKIFFRDVILNNFYDYATDISDDDTKTDFKTFFE